MFTHRPNVEELREEMKSLDKNTLNRIIKAAQEELARRYQKLNDPHRELVIEDGKVRKFK